MFICKEIGRQLFSKPHFEIFFLFFPENRFDISSQLSPMKIKGKNIYVSSAELAQRALEYTNSFDKITFANRANPDLTASASVQGLDCLSFH